MKCACEPAAGNGRAYVRVKDFKERIITLNLGGTTAQSSLWMIVLFYFRLSLRGSSGAAAISTDQKTAVPLCGIPTG